MKKILLFAVGALAATAAFAQPKLTADNIDEIINAMTIEEKVTLLVGGSRPITIDGVPTGTTNLVPGAAGVTRAVPRLGITQTVLADGPAGVRISPRREGDPNTYYATAFPVGTALATSWNLDLVKEVTEAMGQEVLEFGVDVLLAPGMNIHRNVLCGRNFEYFSEDPYLSGKMAAAYVNGIQSNGVGTSVKHYAANNQETNRHENDSRVSQRALREIYLKNFEIAIKEGNPWTVMSSYNILNGEYTQQSYDLLTTILRDEWGWDGIVMTDWGNKQGTVKSVKAGNDVMEPGNQVEMERILEGVKNGEITMEEIDRNVRNMLEYIVKTPRFKGYEYSSKPDTEEHAKLVRKAGAEGMVLLKNNGVLPLKGDEKVGLWGVTSYDFIAGGTGSGNVNKAYIRNVQEGLEGNGVAVDPAPASWYKKYISYTEETMNNNAPNTLWGKPVLPEAELSKAFVTKVEAGTDVAILTIGRNAGEGGDRKDGQGDFRLNAVEVANLQNICDAYHKSGKKVIVVLNIGGVIETASWKHMPDAILLAWQPGMEGGASVADVLLGKVNPSGKLATTFPMNYLDNHDKNSYNGSIVERFGADYQTLFALTFLSPGMPLIYTSDEEGYDHEIEFFEKDAVQWDDEPKYAPLIRTLSGLKTDHAALASTNREITFMETDHPNAIAFCRSLGEDKVVYIGSLFYEEINGVTVDPGFTSAQCVLHYDGTAFDTQEQEMTDKDFEKRGYNSYEFYVLVVKE